MIRFLFCVAILILAFFLFYNADRFQHFGPAEPDAPVIEPSPEPEPEPVGPAPEPEEPDPVDPDPIEPEPLPEPEPDVLIDENGKTFSYYPAGDLINGSAPPDIIVDDVVYDDQILFPTEGAVYLNSQQYGHGGFFKDVNGKGPDQCDTENYDYPWRDNFCEKRNRNQYFCSAGGHTGADIRPSTCSKETHWVVAPEDGEVYRIGSYSVRMMSDDGTWYQFLHMDMDSLALDRNQVSAGGQRVVKGQRLGKISNVYFDGSGNEVPTTIHLHLDIKESYAPTNGDDPFIDRVNPYMTLVAAYERKLLAEE